MEQSMLRNTIEKIIQSPKEYNARSFNNKKTVTGNERGLLKLTDDKAFPKVKFQRFPHDVFTTKKCNSKTDPFVDLIKNSFSFKVKMRFPMPSRTSERPNCILRIKTPSTKNSVTRNVPANANLLRFPLIPNLASPKRHNQTESKASQKDTLNDSFRVSSELKLKASGKRHVRHFSNQVANLELASRFIVSPHVSEKYRNESEEVNQRFSRLKYMFEKGFVYGSVKRNTDAYLGKHIRTASTHSPSKNNLLHTEIVMKKPLKKVFPSSAKFTPKAHKKISTIALGKKIKLAKYDAPVKFSQMCNLTFGKASTGFSVLAVDD
eukprot:TRINITY_DN8025_c0_g1_i17.p1 TRINITY_DN8025_c0_g1~~TRINITY_DN8025_c0_g1_i17.p1  ORF type:complete len:321 (-),score=53.01 TRINITY_DN8025_c0_g1_i17:74-1036(-)